MGHAISFDTLAFAKKIEASGMDIKQSEAVAEAIKEVFDENLSLVIFTKADGELLKAELKTVKAELKADNFKLKSEMIMWVVGLMLAQTAIMISMIKFLH